MGSLLSSCSRMLTVGSFDMVGVPAAVAWEVLSDLEAYPSYVPHILEVQLLRGVTSSTSAAVGASWNERRMYHGKEIIMRKTITGLNLDPENATYTVKVVVHINGMHFNSPDAVETCTFTVAPQQLTEDDKGEKQQSCTFSWTMAYISAGLRSTLMVLLFKSCVLRSLNRYVDEEMQYYYKEAIRRTEQQKENVEKSSSETNSSL